MNDRRMKRLDIWDSSAFDECLEGYLYAWIFFSPPTFSLNKYTEEVRDCKGVENMRSHNKVGNVQ